MELAETHKHLISEGCVLWWQCLSRCTQAWLSHTTWMLTLNLQLPVLKMHTLCFFFFWPHTFQHFCLSSTKNSGPQAWHLLNSRETTNIIFMLRLNPSWGSQGRVDSSVKQSKALWIFFFWANRVTIALTVCLGVCIAYRHPSAVWFIRSRRYFSNKRVREGKKTLALQFTPSTPGRWRVVEADRKTLVTFNNCFLKRLGHFFWTNKISNNLNHITGSQMTITKARLAELSTTGKDCWCVSYHWQIWVWVQSHSHVNILALGWKYK